MSDTGIGARVKRKEDQRFITGKGRYTDDINLKGQTYAYFVRSPHAHAAIKSINTAKAKKMPGVVGVLTGAEVAEDKIGGLICGWMIHSKDGSPMKAGPHPILAQGKVRYVGDHVAVVIAETKEQVGGFYLIECANLDEVLEIARVHARMDRRVRAEVPDVERVVEDAPIED